MNLNPSKTMIIYLLKNVFDPIFIAQLDYLVAENKILRAQVKKPKLSNAERFKLGKLGLRLKKLSPEIFRETVNIFTPETILRWARKAEAKIYDSSKVRKRSGRRKIFKEIENMVVKIAKENRKDGYTKIKGRMDNLGYEVSESTIRNILKRNGFAPRRNNGQDKSSWAEFLKSHADLIWGTDFLTVPVWINFRVVPYYVLIFIHHKTRQLQIMNVTPNPKAPWVDQQARNFVYDLEEKPPIKNLIRDRDNKFLGEFDNIFNTEKDENGEGIRVIKSYHPNMNSITERVVQSIKNECTKDMVFITENQLRRALKQYEEHYNSERNHQGLDNTIPIPLKENVPKKGKIQCKERLGGLLKYYYREAA